MQITRGQRHYGVTVSVADISVSYDYMSGLTAASKGKPKPHVQQMPFGGCDLANLCINCAWVAIALWDRETQEPGTTLTLKSNYYYPYTSKYSPREGEPCICVGFPPGRVKPSGQAWHS